jgi:hypothetical protein
MSRLPGGGGFGAFQDGPGKGVAERLLETPYLAYAFLLALVACFLFYLLDHRRLLGYVQINLAISILVVALLRNTQGHGWQYSMIWIFGCIGCLTYWLDRLLKETYSTH